MRYTFPWARVGGILAIFQAQSLFSRGYLLRVRLLSAPTRDKLYIRRLWFARWGDVQKAHWLLLHCLRQREADPTTCLAGWKTRRVRPVPWVRSPKSAIEATGD